MAIIEYEEALKAGPPEKYTEEVKKEILKELEGSLRELKGKIGAGK